jgi:O-antigen/teichoic acid export membrane protein
MRVNNAINNIFVGVLCQLFIAFLGFISRKVFLDSLGVEYLGVNALLTSILSMLALIEGGIGASIVYSLYKPLAANDRSRVIALIQLYKKAYACFAVIFFILSIIMYPFLDNLMNESEQIPFIAAIYFIFVIKNIITFLNAHKVSLINADQKGYVLVRVDFIFQVITTVAKIIVLIKTENYILYLLIELVIFSIQTIFNGRIVDKRYSYIKTTVNYTIDEKERSKIINNIKAIFLHNVGTFCVFGTDNILISAFVSVVALGIYSNYTMIISQVSSLIFITLSGIGASVGNLIATENSHKNYQVFQVVYFVNFWLCSVSVIFLYNLLEPFITWWLGAEYMLDSIILTAILLNFYITGMRSSILTFKTKGGIFVQDRYVPLIEAAINLAISIVLVKLYGLLGIFVGTTISTLSTTFWNVPRLVYKNIFNISVWIYFKKYIYYTLLTLATCFLTTTICNLFVVEKGFRSLVEIGLISIIIPNSLYIVIFCKSREFQYIKNVLILALSKAKRKLLLQNN